MGFQVTGDSSWQVSLAHEPGSIQADCLTPLLNPMPNTLIPSFHPLDTALQMHAHILGAVVMNAAMTGQDPLEFVVE